MAEQTISITLNGEKKEVAADQTGVQLFSDDKNIIAVRLNGEPRDLYTELHDGDVVEPTISMSRPLSLRRTSRKSKSACSALSSPPSPSAAAW